MTKLPKKRSMTAILHTRRYWCRILSLADDATATIETKLVKMIRTVEVMEMHTE